MKCKTPPRVPSGVGQGSERNLKLPYNIITHLKGKCNMKETTKMSRATGYLEKIFRELNKDSFGGVLEEPIITIQSTPRAYGHVSLHKTWKRKDDWRHELNISADWLTRPIENVVATMIHEMVHLYNIQNDIQDCTRGGSYHNKRFKAEAEKHMLSVERDDTYGWTITKPTDELLEYILSKGWSEIVVGKNPLYGLLGGAGDGGSNPGDPYTPTAKPTATKRKSSYRRYTCPGCGLIARTTKDATLICGTCQIELELND